MNTLMKRNSDLLGGLMDTFWSEPAFLKSSDIYHKLSMPAVNIKENENEFVVELAAPGLNKENFNIEIEENVLKVSSQMEQTTEENKENYTRKEFSFQSFQRSFTLPKDRISTENVNAKYENGVLMITLPKQVKTEDTVKKIAVI